MKSKIEVKHYKVLSLPISAEPNSIYYVLDSTSGKVKTYISDRNGIPIPLIDLTGMGTVQSVTGTGVTGSLTNPKIDIATFISGQMGNLVELSLEDGKLVVKGITSPNSSISITETTSELQIQLSASIKSQIDSALQPGANMSDLTNDVGYIMTIDVEELAQDAIGTILADTATIELAYTDLIPSITANVKSNSITSAELSDTINISEFINDSSFETTTQLNVRDTNNRSRANHTGTQLATTISDFTSAAKIAVVDNSITGGIIDKAPSENAVFDALVLKEDKTNKQNSLTADGTGIKYTTVDAVRTHTTDLNNPHSVTKTQVGLSNVDNTSDINKPISTAQQIAIDAKVADTITNGVTTIAPSQNAVFNSLSLKAYLPTGLLKNGALSINVVNTTYNLSAGTGIITNFDNPDAPTSRIVTFPEVIGKTPTYLTTAIITYVGIQEIGTTGVGQIIEQATPFTTDQNHDLIPIGAVIHSNLTNINYVNNITNPSNDIGGQFHTFLDKLGAFNVTGNKFVANGANLGLNKSAGSLYKRGSNFINNWKNANEIAQGETNYLTFRYRTQIDNEGADRINLDPSLYDLGGVLTAVPSNKFTIQTVNVFQEGAVRVQWGQTIYNSLAEAEAALPTRSFVKESNIALQAVPRAYIIMRNSTTSLQNTADAKIIEAGKFDGFISGGAALTLDAIISVLGYTPENVANKTGTLTASSVLYPNNNAVIAGLSLKRDITNYTFASDLLVNDLTIGRGFGNISTNTAIGYRSIYSNTTGLQNTAIGSLSLYSNTSGNQNVSNGYQSLYSNTIGSNNVSIGATSLYSNISGSQNTSVGYQSLYANSTGYQNNSIGYRSLYSNTTGFNNLSIGSLSMFLNTTGSNNLSIGSLSLYSNTSGNQNVSNGYQSLYSNTIGNNNVSLGFQALYSNISGMQNASIGTGAGSFIADKISPATVLNGSIMLGYRTSPLADNQANQIVIGYDATGLGSNTTVLGNSSTTFGRFWGKLLIGKSTNDGINDIQTNSFISSGTTTLGDSQPTANNQLTRKDYTDTALALKANKDNAALTGIPTAPTASLGTNTTQLATTAFVQSAIPANIVDLSSIQTITGTKSLLSTNTFFGGAIKHHYFNLTANAISWQIYDTGVSQGGFFIGANTVGFTIRESGGVFIQASKPIVSPIATASDQLVNKSQMDKNTLVSYTVATLPATPSQGDSYAVTDALTPTYLTTVVGGGTVYSPVVWNGTNWVSH